MFQCNRLSENDCGGQGGLGKQVDLLGREEFEEIVGGVILRVDDRRVGGLEEADRREAVLEERLAWHPPCDL